MLSKARTTEEAVTLLRGEDVMVSHIVFVADKSGAFSIVERAPGVPAHVRSGASITNSLRGSLASDPKNEDIRKTTTTLARRDRIDQLLAKVAPGSATKESVLEMLRDHECATEACAPGDRRSIDAFIATHGVVADLTARELWVSEGPRLSGKFVKVSLVTPHEKGPALEVEELPADPALTDGRYAAGRIRAGGPLMGAKKP